MTLCSWCDVKIQEQTEAGVAQLVERWTEQPDTILMQVQVPGAARDIFPAESTSSADSLKNVRTAPVLNRLHQHLRAH